ncbi:hypothetical protein [Marinobacter salarius]|uniref:hypothetical protein n=1 Tax=Marinobacter salarius TaxID=1420917 RepID=UPI001BCD4748|nr:hypothetical protein [Marinobacter salarius]
MKSLKEQLSKLFGRPLHGPNKKSKWAKQADVREAKIPNISEESKKDKKRAKQKNVLAKRKRKKIRNRKRRNHKDLELSAEAIHLAYHPVSKPTKISNSLGEEKTEQRPDQSQGKLLASRPLGQQPNTQCAHCGKPAMSGYDVCLRCSMN